MIKPRILIVEDELIVARDIKNILSNTGYSVPAIFSSGIDLIDFVKTNTPDLILMDIKLKGEMDGIETTRQVKTICDVPIVYMTANADEEIIVRAKKTEPHGFIYKPIQVDIIKNAIEMALFKFEKEKKLYEQQEWLNAAFNSIKDAVITTNKEGIITFINPAAIKISGCNYENYKGLPLTDIFNLVNAKTKNLVSDPVSRVIETDEISEFVNQTILLNKEDKAFRISNSSSPVLNSKGQIIGVVLVFRETMQENEIKSELVESEKRYKTLFNSMLEGVCLHNVIYDESGKAIDYEIIDVNPKFEQILDLKRADVVNMKATEIYKTDIPPYLDIYAKVAQTGNPAEFEAFYEPMKKNFLISVFSPGENQFATVFEDITESKRTKSALHERIKELQAFYRISKIMEHSNINLDEIYQEIANILPFSWQYPEITCSRIIIDDKEYKSDNFKITEWMQSADVKAFEKVIGEIQIVYLKELPERDEGPFSKEERMLVDTIAEQLGHITERKRVELKIVNNEKYLHNIIQTVIDGFWIIDINGILIDANNAYLKMTGYTREELLKFNINELDALESPSDTRKRINRIVENGSEIFETQLLRKDKQIIDIEVSSTFADFEGGQFLCFGRDITERKQLEMELKESKLFLDNMSDIAYIADVNGNVVWVNAASERVTGLSKKDVIGKAFLPLFIDKDHPSIRDMFKRTLKGESLENTITFTSGITCQVSSIPKKNEKGEIIGTFGIARDITERKRIESEREITIGLLEIINEKKELSDLMQSVLTFMFELSGCEAVGIRLKEEQDFPYYETRGFSEKFVKKEKYLCAKDLKGQILKDEIGNPVLECMCGNVLCGRFDASLPFFTEHGSFVSNGTSKLLASTTETERQASTRNRCNAEGYESVMLVPLRAGGETFGLLQFNDHREGRFTEQFVDQIERMAGNISIALAQRKAEKDLSEKQYYLTKAQEIGKIGTWELDVVENVLTWTDENYRIFGVPLGTKLNLEVFMECVHPDDRVYVTKEWTAALQGVPYDIEHRLLVNGKVKWVHEKANVEFDKNGKALLGIGFTQDITQLKIAEEKIRKKDLEFRKLSKHLPDMIYQFSRKPDGTYYVPISSEGIVNIFGCTPQDVVDTFEPVARVIHTDDFERVVETVEISAKNLSPFRCEYRVVLPEKGVQWILSNSTPELLPDGTVTWFGFTVNITDRKQAEEQIKKDLLEKEVLIREIHHRVKNNLQVIISLLSLQSEKIEDPEIRDVFNQSRNRVYSMAMVHEQLYQSKELSKIEMQKYIETIVRDLKIMYAPQKYIKSNIQVDSIYFDVVHAIPCGLILNELVSNAYKHAFKNREKGEIIVKLSAKSEKYELVVKDDGAGLPPKFDPEHTDTLGMQLVKMLSLQLEGDLKIENKRGTSFTLEFKD